MTGQRPTEEGLRLRLQVLAHSPRLHRPGEWYVVTLLERGHIAETGRGSEKRREYTITDAGRAFLAEQTVRQVQACS